MLHSFFVEGSVIALAMLGASTVAIASPANESRVNPAAKFRILYSLQRQGRTLVAASTLMRDKVGNLYGTTMNGGSYGAGSVF